MTKTKGTFACDFKDCKTVAKNAAGLGSHKFKTHGIRGKSKAAVKKKGKKKDEPKVKNVADKKKRKYTPRASSNGAGLLGMCVSTLGIPWRETISLMLDKLESKKTAPKARKEIRAAFDGIAAQMDKTV